MRRLLLLAALCALAVLALAPAAMAQTDLNCPDLSEAEEQAVFNADPSDPNNLDANDNGIPCEDDTTDNGSYVPPAEDDATPGPADDEADDVQYGADDVQYGADDVQYNATPTAALPETGGLTPALALVPLALLVAGGLLATRIVRRG